MSMVKYVYFLEAYVLEIMKVKSIVYFIDNKVMQVKYGMVVYFNPQVYTHFSHIIWSM